MTLFGMTSSVSTRFALISRVTVDYVNENSDVGEELSNIIGIG